MEFISSNLIFILLYGRVFPLSFTTTLIYSIIFNVYLLLLIYNLLVFNLYANLVNIRYGFSSTSKIQTIVFYLCYVYKITSTIIVSFAIIGHYNLKFTIVSNFNDL